MVHTSLVRNAHMNGIMHYEQAIIGAEITYEVSYRNYQTI